MARDTAVQAATKAALQAMRQRGYSQTTIAQELGTSQPTVSRWENGTSTPSAAHLQQLAAYTGQSLAGTAEVQSLEARVAQLEAQLAALQAHLQEGA